VHWLRERTERRRVARSQLPDGTPCLVKHFLAPRRHRLRELAKRALGQDGARREWRALARLHAAGRYVPRPLALLRLGRGEDALVTEWIEGPTLSEALAAAPPARRRALDEVGRRVRELHDAGWAHRDLHRGNVILAETGPVFVDLQAAVPRCSQRARHRDLGMLDHSLRGRLGIGNRLRLRAAGLGLARPFDAAARAALRAAGSASQRRQRETVRSRAQRSLRAGRRARRLRLAGGTGLIARSADETELGAALEAQTSAPRIAVRRHPARWRDLLLGSGARRGWQRGFALAAASVPGAEPLAFVETRRFGRPGSSTLWLRAPEPCAAPSLEERVLAWARLWARLEATGFRPPPPDEEALYFERRGGRVEAGVAAAEDVGLPRPAGPAGNPAALDALERAWRALGADDELCRRGRVAYRRARRCG